MLPQNGHECFQSQLFYKEIATPVSIIIMIPVFDAFSFLIITMRGQIFLLQN